MKCPMCNGSGKCYEQKIRYQEIETNRTDFTIAQCHKCNGTGEVQMTEQEYLQTCNTEQLAECLTNISFNTGYDSYNVVRRKIMKWLKQPHNS